MANIPRYYYDDHGVERYKDGAARSTFLTSGNNFSVAFENNVRYRLVIQNMNENKPTGDSSLPLGNYGDMYRAFYSSSVTKIKQIPIDAYSINECFKGSSIKEIESGIIPNTVTSIAEAFSYTKYFSQDLDFQTNTSLNFYRTFENSNYNGVIKTNVPPHSLDYAFSNSIFNSSTDFVKNATSISMRAAFYNDYIFNQDIDLRTASLQDGYRTFFKCQNFNSNIIINNLKTWGNQEINLEQMFCYCNNLTSPGLKILEDKNYYNIVSYYGMYYNCEKMNGDFFILPSFNLQQMFCYCNNFNGNITFHNKFYNMESIKVNMESFLLSCRSFNQPLTLPENVTNLHQTFGQCEKLNKEIKINFNSPVEDFSKAFAACTSFDYPVIIPKSVTNITDAFGGCLNLTHIGTKLISLSGLRYADNAFSLTKNLADYENILFTMKMPLESISGIFQGSGFYTPSIFHLRYLYGFSKDLYRVYADGICKEIYKIDDSINCLKETFYGAKIYSSYIDVLNTIDTLDYTFSNAISMAGTGTTIQIENGIKNIFGVGAYSSGLKFSLPDEYINIDNGSFLGATRVCYNMSTNEKIMGIPSEEIVDQVKNDIANNNTSAIVKEWGSYVNSFGMGYGPHQYSNEIQYDPGYCYKLGGKYVTCSKCGGRKYISYNEEYAEHKFEYGYCKYCGMPENQEQYFYFVIGILENGLPKRDIDNTIIDYENDLTVDNKLKRAFITGVKYDLYNTDFGEKSVITFPDKIRGYITIVV